MWEDGRGRGRMGEDEGGRERMGEDGRGLKRIEPYEGSSEEESSVERVTSEEESS